MSAHKQQQRGVFRQQEVAIIASVLSSSVFVLSLRWPEEEAFSLKHPFPWSVCLFAPPGERERERDKAG